MTIDLRALTAAGLSIALAVACSQASEEAPSASSSQEAAAPLPDPAEAGLVTPEEASQEAEAAIDPSNAESELEALQREVGGG
jgi:hypothetical protein